MVPDMAETDEELGQSLHPCDTWDEKRRDTGATDVSIKRAGTIIYHPKHYDCSRWCGVKKRKRTAWSIDQGNFEVVEPEEREAWDSAFDVVELAGRRSSYQPERTLAIVPDLVSVAVHPPQHVCLSPHDTSASLFSSILGSRPGPARPKLE